MKRFSLLFVLALSTAGGFSQTFIHYGNQTITRDEFLKAYNKNRTPVTDPEKSLREYVDLYTNFKLKVQAARELKLDTLPQIEYDIANFRQQIAENYLSDNKSIERLVFEAFYRMQKDKHVLYFSAPVAPDARPEDTLRSYKAIMDIYTALNNKSADYNKLVQTANTTGAVVKNSDFGYVTAFTVPYEFENIIYGLKEGEAGKPYRGKSGWHVFKVIEERPSAGRWRVAQILISFAPDANAAAKDAAAKEAQAIYERAAGGESFAALVKEYSDDKLSYSNAGELPEFGTGTYSYAFEKEVHKLRTDGEISKPFATDFGYHIVKRLGFTPTPTDTGDLTYMYDLRQKIMKDSRVNAEKERFAKEITTKIGLKKTNLVKEADLLRYADSIMTNPTVEQTKKYPISNKTILSFKNGAVKGEEWLSFVRENRSYGTQNKTLTNKQLWEKFIPAAAINYYKNHLEEYNPDFKFQMQEFKEGNMLFEIMERNVWGMASTDTVALLKHYNANKSNFKWAASADVLIFNCSTAKVAEDAMIALKKGKEWRAIAEEFTGTLQADSGRYEINQIIGANYAGTPVKNSYTAIVSNVDGTATFVKYVNVYPADQQRSFEEARGLVINDYQQVLENKWIAELKKKYPVRVNEAMLKEMVR